MFPGRLCPTRLDGMLSCVELLLFGRIEKHTRDQLHGLRKVDLLNWQSING